MKIDFVVYILIMYSIKSNNAQFKRKLRALEMVEKKRGKNREDKPNRGSNKRP